MERPPTELLEAFLHGFACIHMRRTRTTTPDRSHAMLSVASCGRSSSSSLLSLLERGKGSERRAPDRSEVPKDYRRELRRLPCVRIRAFRTRV